MVRACCPLPGCGQGRSTPRCLRGSRGAPVLSPCPSGHHACLQMPQWGQESHGAGSSSGLSRDGWCWWWELGRAPVLLSVEDCAQGMSERRTHHIWLQQEAMGNVLFFFSSACPPHLHCSVSEIRNFVVQNVESKKALSVW